MIKILIVWVVALGLPTVAASAQGGPMIPATSPPSQNMFEVTPSTAEEQLDYHLLYNNTFNQVDIDQAKTRHLSDRQIAKIYKLAKLSRSQFRDVFARVEDGQTFSSLACWAGVDLNNLNNCQREEDDINGFESGNAATGLGNSPRDGRVESAVDSVKKGR